MPRWSLLLLTLSACAPAAPARPAPGTTPPAAGTADSAIPHGLRWFRTSAEQRAAFLQTYTQAGEQLRGLAAEARAPWAVILDADETILDNSTYQLRQARLGRGFDLASWNAWVRERTAGALPGAAEFTEAVRRMGGRVVVVTNRDAEVCDDTRANLQAVGVRADAVLCREGSSDKNPRFRAVAAGTAAVGLPPLQVLMWVGDNIQDFPELTQEIRSAPASAFERFGRTWFILPNPMYGSWERNPVP